MTFEQGAFLWVLALLVLLVIITIQDWLLWRRLKSKAWACEIAALTLSTIGLIFRITFHRWLTPATRLITTLSIATVVYLGLMISRFLMHLSLEALMRTRRSGSTVSIRVLLQTLWIYSLDAWRSLRAKLRR